MEAEVYHRVLQSEHHLLEQLFDLVRSDKSLLADGVELVTLVDG